MDHTRKPVTVVHLLLKGDHVEEKDDFVEECNKRAMIAVQVPTLQFCFTRQDDLKLELLKMVDNKNRNGLILTSPRAVKALKWVLNLVHSDKRKKILSAISPDLIFVVGKKTAHTVRSDLELDCNQDSIKTGKGSALVALLKESHKNFSPTVNLLYPSIESNSYASELSSLAHLNLTFINAYETSLRPQLESDIIEAMKGLSLDSVPTHQESKSGLNPLVVNLVLFSPEAARGLNMIPPNKLLTDLQHMYAKSYQVELQYTCLGKTTEAKLIEFGIHAAGVAKQPTVKSLVDMLAEVTLLFIKNRQPIENAIPHSS